MPGEKKVMQRKGLRMNEKVGRSGFLFISKLHGPLMRWCIEGRYVSLGCRGAEESVGDKGQSDFNGWSGRFWCEVTTMPISRRHSRNPRRIQRHGGEK